jgi:hypothetical protein
LQNASDDEQTLQTEEEDVDCTAIEEEEEGGKRNILQKILSKKNFSLKFFCHAA